MNVVATAAFIIGTNFGGGRTGSTTPATAADRPCWAPESARGSPTIPAGHVAGVAATPGIITYATLDVPLPRGWVRT